MIYTEDKIADLKSLYLRGKYEDVIVQGLEAAKELESLAPMLAFTREMANRASLIAAEGNDERKKITALSDYRRAQVAERLCKNYLKEIREVMADADSFLTLVA